MKANMIGIEFQAVVMAAGKGSRMPEMTAGQPKCLLPIANYPMIWYPLRLLEKTGFRECIVIVLESVKTEVQQALDAYKLNIQLDIVGIPAGEDWGTADSLRFINEKIHNDVVVISCDVVTDFNLTKLLNQFRLHHASLTSLFFRPVDNPVQIPGPKVKYKADRDIVGLDHNNSRLVFLASASDFENEITMPHNLLRKHQHIDVHSRLIDSHIYVMKNWICNFLINEKSMSTIKGELLPYVVRKQLTKSVRDKDVIASSEAAVLKQDLLEFSCDGSIDDKVALLSSYSDHSMDLKPPYHGDTIRCFATVAPKTCFGFRANTMTSYCNINLKIMDNWASITGLESLTRINPKAEVKSTQIDNLCLVGSNSLLSEKTSFKSSFIGNNCIIEPKTRVVNCIILNNVAVKEGCVLMNCVICNNVTVSAHCEIKECLIGSNHVVPEIAKHTNEVLTDTDRLMEI